MAESKFPSEVVSLPSQGYFYPEDSILSSGKIEIKYMTAKEEDILTSQNLIKQGVALDKLLESLIINKDIDMSEMIIGDKNGLMVAARILGYGKNYDFSVTCPACGEVNKDTVNLTMLPEKEIDFEKYPKGVNEFSFTLPTSKRKITFKMLTHTDEKEIDAELKAMKKVSKNTGIDPEMTTRMRKIISSVDGNSERAYVNKFVNEEFLSKDSLAFRNHLTVMTPDIDMTYNFECSLCAQEEEMTVPMTVQFLWPSAKG
jgi:hypothetical protein|tara:strand:- start:236 stop:1009 length:774 start_codon:yes stop_codon:yes gene_type:complete